MNEDVSGVARTDRYVYRRRYLDEEVWELVSVDTVRRALADVYRDVPTALDFLRETGVIRTSAAMFEARPVRYAEC